MGQPKAGTDIIFDSMWQFAFYRRKDVMLLFLGWRRMLEKADAAVKLDARHRRASPTVVYAVRITDLAALLLFGTDQDFLEDRIENKGKIPNILLDDRFKFQFQLLIVEFRNAV